MQRREQGSKSLQLNVLQALRKGCGCHAGARYSMYCANVARTYVIDPSKEQEAQYKALLDAQAAAIAALVEGAPLSAAHEAATATLQV